MKLGLVGFGRWAEKIVASLPPGVEIAAVATRRLDCPLPRVARVKDLPAGLDGVIVAGAVQDRYGAVSYLVGHHPYLPLFIEKPVALLPGDVEDYSADSEGLVLVDHIQLFNEHLIDLKAKLDGVPPAHVRYVDRNHGPFRQDCHPLWDYGPHAVAAALYLSGFPFKGGVHVRDAWLDESEEGCTIDMELQLGAKTVATLSVGNNAMEKARHCSVRPFSSTSTFTFEGLASCSIPPLSAALAAFCDAVRAGKAPEGDIRFGWDLPLAVTQALSDVETVLSKRCTPLHPKGITHA